MGVLAATGLIVGESLFGVAFAGIAAWTGDPEALVVAGEWGGALPLGALMFVGAIWWLYGRIRSAARG